MTEIEQRARILEKTSQDYVLKHNGKVIRSRRTFTTTEAWEKHQNEEIRRLKIKLKAAGTADEKRNILRQIEIRKEIMHAAGSDYERSGAAGYFK